MAYAQSEDSADRVRAPDFKGADGWINTQKPISITDLRGQVVLLDFWTYCCINCMHILPDLKYLEDKYKDQPFVVIGVHSGKFDQEKDPENIRKAVLRHNVAHPVAVDSDYEIWNAYTVKAWPTLVLIDPEGYAVGYVSGEGHRDELDKRIAALLDEQRRKGALAKPMKFRLERESFKPGVLQFPGKVLADSAGQRLFISDTNHHRVLVADLSGKVRTIIGQGEIGLKDGAFADAQFHQPQGLALSEDGKTLYVADTENHAIRAADLAGGRVTTLAGTGQQSHDFKSAGPGAATALSSPWDLARVGSQLYIAMAGTHQIWALDLGTRQVRVFAGTGRETRTDGPREKSAFAQPSGLASDGKRLFVADSEISSVRTIELGPGGAVATLAGSGGLFDFGRRDGQGESARFQHPLGVALADDVLYVADTFNHLIRTIDVKSGEVTTWLGTGKPEPGTADRVGLFEPGGLAVAGDVLYIADTNQHRIIAVDRNTKSVRVLEITLPDDATKQSAR